MRFLHLISCCFKKQDQIEKNRLLYHCVYKKNHKRVIKLLRNGADPNTIISYNQPIDLAIHQEDLKMIRILIFYGAILNKDEASKLFCNDCRKNFDYINMIYELNQKYIQMQMNNVCKKYKVPPGLDIYLKSFISK